MKRQGLVFVYLLALVVVGGAVAQDAPAFPEAPPTSENETPDELPPPLADDVPELDLLASFAINARMDLAVGYSHFFAGAYYKLTPGVPSRNDADFLYTQFTVNF